MSTSNKINVMVVSGSHERLQMAGMVASVGAVSGSEVTVFLSMNALQYFIKGNNAAAPAEGPFGETMAKKNVPEFKSLFENAVTLGDAKIFPCSMAIDVLNVNVDDLEPYLSEPLGLTKFLNDTADSQIWTF
ncbi:DsrE/DsrF/DrsH-like family protein [Kaarinaea lacus]